MSRLLRAAEGPPPRELPGLRARRLVDRSVAPTLHGLTMSVVEFAPGEEAAFQAHLEQEAFYFLDGTAIAEVGGEHPERLEVSAGDFLYIESGETHRVRSKGPGWARALVVKTGRDQ